VVFAESPLTPHVSVAHFFGAELRLRRRGAGMSIRALAPRVLASPPLLEKVERAVRFPSADLAMRCDHELDADGALIRLHGLVVAERESATPHEDILSLAGSLHAALIPFAAPLAAASTTALVQRIDDALSAAGVADLPAARPTRAATPAAWPPNERLRAARLRMASPAGAARPLSRAELADLINGHLTRCGITHAVLDGVYISKLERGVHRWPQRQYRDAFRAVLGAQHDAELGFYVNRRTPRRAGHGG